MQNSKIISKPFRLFMILPFLLMFLQINIQKEITVLGWHFGYSLAGPKNSICILPSGDTIVPGHEEWMTLVGIDSVIDVGPVLDSWMLRGELSPGVRAYDVFKNGIRNTTHADKKVYVIVRKLDEFKKEQFIYASLIAVASKKGHFELMKDTSQQVDRILSQRKDYTKWPVVWQQLYNERWGKPKLRAYLTYLAYSMYGGENKSMAAKLASISELSNLHVYTHNYAIDNKHLNISDNRNCILIGAGEMFSNEANQMICKLPNLSGEKKIEIISKFSQDIAGIYQGQFMDSQPLSQDLMDEETFIKMYKQRCELLSGTMYGSSLWLGAFAAPKSTVSECELMYKIGYALGAGLQVVNDIGDFSFEKQDGFSDIKTLKPTAPIYYMAQICGLKKLSKKTPKQLQKFLMKSESFQKSKALAQLYRHTARVLIKILPACEERNRMRQVTSSIKTNRHLTNIKNA